MSMLRSIAASLTGALLLSALPMTAVAPAQAAVSPTAVVAAAEPGEGSRDTLDFNRSWKFVREDVPAAKDPGFDDSSWVDVALPHAFDAPYSVGGANGGEKFFVGVGWYRKTFDVPESWAGKRLELDFEGSFQITDIWVNGEHVTTHRGGFTGFGVDISDYVTTGANEIAVSVDNRWHHDLSPRAGDHQFTGGIYRDVTLSVTDDVHVAWYGTAVTTPALTNPDWDTSNAAYYRNIDLTAYPTLDALKANIDAKRSNVRVATEIENEGSEPVDVSVVQEISDPDGKVIATFESASQTIAAGLTATVDASSGALDDTTAMLTDLRLWSPTDPALYGVKSSVVVGEKVVDSFSSSFGFRSAQFRKDGFYLNGVKTLLFGANAHQDQAGWGNAVADSGFRRDVAQIREAGMNLIRGSHYPHDPAYAQATDELGVMLWSENVFWGMGGQSGKDADPLDRPSDWLRDAYPQNPADEPAFEQSTLDALEAMIRVNRNHPSIINWSMGNEVFFTASATQAKAKALVSKLRDRAHQLDPTRKAGMGGVQRNGFDQLSVSDIAGYNGDGGDIVNSVMSNLVAEYGSYTSDRPGSYDPRYDYVQKPGDRQEFQLTQNSGGLVLWAGFDHGTVGGANLARMGMIDYSRLPKDQWYWYRANKARWTSLTTVADSTPIARETSIPGTATAMTLAPSSHSSTRITDDGRTDTQLEVTLRNAAGAWVGQTRPITLTVTSGPGILPGGKSYTFLPGVTMFDGKGAVAFRSYYAGTSTITATSEGLPDVTLEVSTADVVGSAGETEPADFGNASLWGGSKAVIAEPTPYGDVNKSLSRPLTATSEQAGHGRALAADGDPATTWIADATGAGQSISSFLEVSQNVYKVRLEFAGPALPFTLEVQGEDDAWSTVASYTAATVAGRPLEESLDGVYAESVRVSFPNLTADQRASLAELQVLGIDSAQSPRYAADGAYVSDILDYAKKVETGYGSKVKDRSADGNPLSVGGKTYAKGVGLHADSVAIVDLGGRYSRLSGIAGIDGESSGKGGDAIFEVYADQKLIFSRELAGTATAAIDLSVDGVDELRLVTDSNGSDSLDHTDWADLRLSGAIRDLTVTGADLVATFAGMSDQLRAGEGFRGSVDLTNTGDTARSATASIGIHSSDGRLLELRTQKLDLAAEASGTVDLTTPVGPSIAGQYAEIVVWDSDTLAPLSKTVRVDADPDRLTVAAPSEIQWTTKVDGENSALRKTGTWAAYATGAAYAGTETFSTIAGSTMAWDFTGQYVRVGAKFDGSQTGFDVLVDGVKAATVSTKVTNGTNAYRVAWTSDALSAGSHTITLVGAGKVGIDYLESGTVPTAPTPTTPAYAGLVKVMGDVLATVTSDSISNADASSRAALADELDAAYALYTTAGSTPEQFTAAQQSLQAALTALAAKPSVALQNTVATRCVAGKIYVTVAVKNTDTVPAAVSIATPWGEKNGVSVAPGKSTTVSVTSRAASVAAGSVSITATAGGREQATYTPTYPAASCG